MREFARIIIENTVNGKIDKVVGAEILQAIKMQKSDKNDIAIIGMSARFPDAKNIDEFWNNIINYKDCIKEYPQNRKSDSIEFVKHFTSLSDEEIEFVKGGYLDDISKFDHNFFKISQREASLMDPNQRLFLETAWKAIEDSGYGGSKLAGSKTGVFVGYANAPLYSQYISKKQPLQYKMAVPGNVSSIIASRIAYILDLKGPSMLIDTACSSTLVSVHMACKSIKLNECDLAIAGGVKINLLPLMGLMDIGIESSEYRTKSFDEDSTGTVWGEGVAALVLKPLNKAISDRDNIYAVIKGSAINQDGTSVGITAPNVLAQTEVILSAWKDAEIDPETISYIEAHGTGTKLGDPIEIDGIQRAFKKFTNKKQFCGIGSVKTNIGHTDNISGIAGLIKAVLALKNRKLPPMINFNKPNLQINFIDSPVYICDKLQDWNTENYPRRCGVSSFGFSGTNCHVILEQSPQRKELIADSELNILALSAKTELQLKMLVSDYMNLIENSKELPLNNICYTANTGRDHYNYRLAIIARNKTELAENLREFLLERFEEAQTDLIQFGKHKLVQNFKIEKEKFELTIEELKELNKKASDKLDEFLVKEKKSLNILWEISNLYVSGAEMDWEALYTGDNVYKVSLPEYPFMGKRHWVDTNTIEHSSKEIPYALIEKCLSESLNQDVFLTSYSQERYWVATDHKVKGNCVPAGTVYMEMAAEACRKYFQSDKMELYDIIMLYPIVVHKGETKDVQTIVKKENGYYEFIIASKKLDESGEKYEWIQHSQGKVRSFFDKQSSNIDIETIKNRCNDMYHVPSEENYNDLSMMWFGPRWRNIVCVYIGKNETLTHIELAKEYVKELESFILQPALLDNALSTYIIQEGSAYLPFSCKSIKIFKKIPGKFYSHVRAKEELKENAEILIYDVTLIGMDGEVLVEIEGSTRKKVYSNPFISVSEAKKSKVFQELVWIPYDSNNYSETPKVGSILVLRDESAKALDICDKLKRDGRYIIEVSFGEGFKKLDENNFIIRGDADDYEKLITHIKDKKITQVLHMFLLSDNNAWGEENTIEVFNYKQKLGVMSAFYLTKQMQNININTEVDMVFISEYVNSVTGKEERINPESAPLFGIAKVINEEYSKLNCRCLDIDTATSIEDIINEINCTREKTVAAYREGIRYVEQLRSLNSEIKKQKIQIKDNGVYVITGGTGGIGLEIAKYLASGNKVNIALVNRSKFPNRNEWDAIVEEAHDKRTIDKINNIKEIESNGSTVICYSVDISKEVQVRELFDELRNDYGKINGIIQSAAVSGNGFIMNKREENFLDVLAPKVSGTKILDEVTKDDNLDFFVMFSSGVSIMGVAGQSDYTAANSYLDSFGAFRNKLGRRTLTINWTAWKEIGMAFDNNAKVGEAFLKAMNSKEAIKAFDKVLNSNLERVVIGELNYNYDELLKNNNFPIELSDEIINKIEESKRKAQNQSLSTNNLDKYENINGRADGVYSQTEKEVAKIFATVLDNEQINIYDDFYELGGDSLIGLKIVNEIENVTGIKVEITDLFKNLTIFELAKFIDENYINKNSANNHEELKIKKAQEQENYSLSSPQIRMFVLNQLNSDTIAYNLSKIIKIEGELDVRRFEHAFEKIINRHEILRTSFHMEDGEIFQRVHDDINFKVNYYEIAEEEVNMELLLKKHIRPFDLSKAPLIRINLVKVNTNKYFLISDMHHIVSDATSLSILVNEFISFYTGKELPDLKLQYKDFVAWQRELIRKETVQKQEQYWLNKFNNQIPVLNLPTDFKRPIVQDFEGSCVKVYIDTETTDRLKKFALKNGVTLFMELFAAYNLVLHKYSGQQDIIVGVPVSGRSYHDIDDLIGVFINTLAMVNHVDLQKTYSEFLNNIKKNALEAYENQDYQYENLINKISQRDLPGNQLFNTIFNLVNITNSSIKISGLEFTFPEYSSIASQIDLKLQIIESTDGLECEFEYQTSLFKRETIERMARHFTNILGNALENTDMPLSEIKMLSETEKNQILWDFNNTAADYPRDKTIHQLFEEQVERTPDNVAAVFEDKQLTYRELNEKSNQLARVLRNKGIKPDTIIGIMVYRSLEMIIGILGILKAGGCYLPIDPEYPKDRIEYMLEDSNAKELLTQKILKDKLDYNVEVIDLDDNKLYVDEKINLENINKPNDLAYVIYTSGSTGRPKGVMIEHTSLINRINWMQKKYPIDSDSVIIQKTPYTFDVSVWELFWWFFVGVKVCFLKPGGEKDPKVIIDAIERYKVSTMHFVPSMLSMFLQYVEEIGDLKRLSSLKQVFASGEALNVQQVNKFNKLLNETNKAELYNLYGPTEATIDVSYFDCSPEVELNSIPIGKPIDNIKLYILDKNNNMLPVGIPGELCIGGVGVARGYLNKPELTAEKFVPNPFAPEEIIYKTGDLVRWYTKGDIEYLGRIDHQVKIRGFRIELGEIENRLIEHEYIKDAVAVGRTDKQNNRYLCIYYVSDIEIPISELKAHLLKSLPEYMVPSYFVRLDKLPLSPNGKVDRKALPEPDSEINKGTEYVAPSNEIEEKLAFIWSEVLSVDKVGVNDNFFELGGHSLKATILISKINKEFEIELPLMELFNSQTISEVANIIRGYKKKFSELDDILKDIESLSELETEIELDTKE